MAGHGRAGNRIASAREAVFPHAPKKHPAMGLRHDCGAVARRAFGPYRLAGYKQKRWHGAHADVAGGGALSATATLRRGMKRLSGSLVAKPTAKGANAATV